MSPQAVSEVIRLGIKSGRIPGAIVAVRKNGHLECLEAQGEDAGFDLAADSVFWVASMTKPLTAAAVLLLVEQGKLKLDVPVEKYIPALDSPRMVRKFKPGALESLPPLGYPAADPEASLEPARRSITVRDLLTMMSGLQTIGIPNSAIPPLARGDTLGTYIPRLAGVPLDFQPGSRWAYSNVIGYEILARLVEISSGVLFQQFVQDHFLTPLGMINSSFGVREHLVKRTAPAAMVANTPLATGTFASGAAGLWTTAEDYSRFAQLLQDRGTHIGRRLLRAETVDAMSSNQIGESWIPGAGPAQYLGLGEAPADRGLKFGFGVALVTNDRGASYTVPAGSYGWDGVGTRRFWVIPSEALAVVMLVPSGISPAAADRFHNEISGAILAS